MQHKDTRSLSEIGVLAARSSPYGLRNPQLSRGGANFAVHSSLFWRLPFINCQGVWILGWLICSPPLPSNQEIRHLPSNQEIRHEPQNRSWVLPTRLASAALQCSHLAWRLESPPTDPKKNMLWINKKLKDWVPFVPRTLLDRFQVRTIFLRYWRWSFIRNSCRMGESFVQSLDEHRTWPWPNLDPKFWPKTSAHHVVPLKFGPHQAPPITPVENICAAW